MSENKNQRICIIDDDPFLLDMYNLKFQQSGYDVVCFTDSTKALEAMRTDGKYDVVLLDLVMPKVDGFEVLQTIRQENLCGEHVVIVILSNQGQEKDISRAEEFGIDGYLIKANTLPSEVLEYVRNLLQKKVEVV
ncbi:MAG: Two component transcriptional regulator, winged helix family [Parcubacteria group bacterium GW2011_GWA2_43_11]|nr:MAG: Two component transcriptional regulator, winged helix family [Parcubacteria group bacterium GW2011_GWC2_42_11]KKS85043.1 MAG: Two component transcriptional regulator, winged helix family [Parcubacteria group bacterium GW2011_GWA2_43_11]